MLSSGNTSSATTAPPKDFLTEATDLRFLAAKQLAAHQITAVQGQAYRPGLSERLYEAIEPHSYHAQTEGNRTRRALMAFMGFMPSERPKTHRAAEDAWRLYLGLPQKTNSFAISKHSPSISRDPNVVYFKLNGFIDSIINDFDANPDLFGASYPHFDNVSSKPSRSDVIRMFLRGIDANKGRLIASDVANLALGNFTVSKGFDDKGRYISYYDVWNLGTQGAQAAARLGIGKPFEIYDRIYYNPKTFEPIDP